MLPLNSRPAHPAPLLPGFAFGSRGARLAWGGVLLLHLLLGGWLGLSVDEAHYALYAAHPALSYFDHPPLVGWVQWPLVALDAPAALLRTVPALLWLAAVLLAAAVAQHLAAGAGWTATAQQQAAGATVAVLLLAPLMHVLGIGLVPDTLLMVWHAALLLLALRLVQRQTLPTLAQWLLLGLLLGLAGLSKYTAIFSALALGACLLQAHGLVLLRQPGAWLAVLLAALLVLPVFVWNAQHGWVSFAYQIKHGAGGSWQALHVLRFALVQVLAYGPLLLWALAAPALAGRGVVWVFFAVPLLVLGYLAGGGSSLPHWTAPAWVALAPLAGLGLARWWAWAGWHRRVLLALGALQTLGCVLLLALMASGGLPWMAGRTAHADATDPPNPFADLHGWETAGAQARIVAAEHGLQSVSVQNWTLASRLGWYARPLAVHVLEDRFDQFDLWAGDLPVGGSTLLVDWSQMPYQLPLGPGGFAHCKPVGKLPVHLLGHELSSFQFWACSGWGGVPQPRLRAVPTPAS